MVLVVASLKCSDSKDSLGSAEPAEPAEASAASGLSSATVVKEEKDSSIFLGVVNAGFRNGGATTLGASWGVKNDFEGGFDGVPKAENEPLADVDLTGEELLNTARFGPWLAIIIVTIAVMMLEIVSRARGTNSCLIASWPPAQTGLSDRRALYSGTPTPWELQTCGAPWPRILLIVDGDVVAMVMTMAMAMVMTMMYFCVFLRIQTSKS